MWVLQRQHGLSRLMRIFPRPSRTPWDPVATKTLPCSALMPRSDRRVERASRRGGEPFSGIILKSTGPILINYHSTKSLDKVHGKLSGAGMPPARDIMPGFAVTLSISLMAFAPILCVRSASKCSKVIVGGS